MSGRSPASVTALVFASGQGLRFSGNKLIALLNGKPIIRHVVERVLASKIERIIVVLGGHTQLTEAALSELSVITVVNPDYLNGMSSTLQAGLAHVPADSGILMVLGDQPTVAPSAINTLLEVYCTSAKPIIQPVYQGVRGHPVLFSPDLRSELMCVTGDRGAREIIARHPELICSVELPFPAPPDVDTKGDLEVLQGALC